MMRNESTGFGAGTGRLPGRIEEQVVNFEEAGTNEVPRLGEFSCSIPSRSDQPDRGPAPWILCGPDV